MSPPVMTATLPLTPKSISLLTVFPFVFSIVHGREKDLAGGLSKSRHYLCRQLCHWRCFLRAVGNGEWGMDVFNVFKKRYVCLNRDVVFLWGDIFRKIEISRDSNPYTSGRGSDVCSMVNLADGGLSLVDQGAGKPVLVFLHYFSGAAVSWQWVMKILQADYRCIALDLPGFGETAPWLSHL